MAETVFDIADTVSQIIQAERQTLDLRIKQNEDRRGEINTLDDIQTKLKTFIRKMDVLQRTPTFQTKKASINDSTIVAATPEVGAAEILFNITVTDLAIAAKTTSTATLFGAGREGTQTNITSAEVNTGIGQSLDPNANVISGSPNFEGGGNLTAGHFIINDSTITVTSTDTVNTLLTKINNSDANLTAYYDSAADKVIIEHNDIGAGKTITLGEDTSGFYTKLKLTEALGAVSTAGVDPDLLQDIEDTALAGSVSDGYFTINKQTFLIDSDNDSLNDIINRINNSKAGVSIFYDETSDKVTMTSDTEGEDIVLENDTSGLLQALKIHTAPTTTITGTPGSVTINGTIFAPEGNELTIHGTKLSFLAEGSTSVKVEPDTSKFVTAVEDLKNAYNDAVTTINDTIGTGVNSSQFLYRLTSTLRQTIQGEITNPGTFSYLSEIGITFSRGVSGGQMEFDQSKFNEKLDEDATSVEKLFSYDSNENGLRDDGGITNTLETFLKEYTKGTLGFFDKREDTMEKIAQKVDTQIQREEDYFTRRQAILTDSFYAMQQMLQKLNEQYQKASSVRVDFSLVTGQALK